MDDDYLYSSTGTLLHVPACNSLQVILPVQAIIHGTARVVVQELSMSNIACSISTGQGTLSYVGPLS